MQENNINPIIFQQNHCCGCGACVSVCPRKCLQLSRDNLGFRIIKIKEKDDCISCGKCRTVCPVFNYQKIPEKMFKRFYGQVHDLDILNSSSSGGAFSAISEFWIRDGGIVWGVGMDEDAKANFLCIRNVDDLYKIRGSKYVEVEQPMPFDLIKEQLYRGEKVLVSGLPCQIRALVNFLGRKYDNFLLIDLLCYGVQSPLIWNKYLYEINPSKKKIKSVFMRYKYPRWEDYSIKIEFNDGSSYIKSRWKDPYLLSYAKNLYNRESCGECKAKEFPRISDITLGDFWQIDTIRKLPDKLQTNRGISVILVNSSKGLRLIEKTKVAMNLFQIPEDVFPNMKNRYSECHPRSNLSSIFISNVFQYGFKNAVMKTISFKDIIKERCRFQWLRLKRKIKHYLR